MKKASLSARIKRLFGAVLVSVAAIFGTLQAPTVVAAVPTRYAPGVFSGVLVKDTVAKEFAESYWANFFVLDSYAEDGQGNVAIYAQTNKHTNAPAFGGVFEVQDVTGKGGFWGIEIDAFSNGPVDGWRNRTGLGVVVGRSGGRGDYAEIDYGVRILPYHYDRGHVAVQYGVAVETHCIKACVKVGSNEKIALDDQDQITIHFDSQTGYLTFANSGRPIFQFQMDTGALVTHNSGRNQ